MAAFTGLLWILCSLLVPETYAPILLRRRAQKLSKITGKAYVSRVDAGRPKKTAAQEFKVALSRPWILLFREPIVFLTSIYMAILYGTLYMCFAAFPIVFQAQRGWSAGIGGLAFLGITVGMTFAVAYSGFDNARYARVSAGRGGMAAPEARLPPALIGSVLLPIGLFWFAWTNGPELHWVVSIIGSAFFAAGLVLVFLSLMNYLVDSCEFNPIVPFSPSSVYPKPLAIVLLRLTKRQTSSTRHLCWRRARSCGRCSARRSRSSRRRCTTPWASTGRAPYPLSWRSRACLSPSCSTNTGSLSGSGVSSPPRPRPSWRSCGGPPPTMPLLLSGPAAPMGGRKKRRRGMATATVWSREVYLLADPHKWGGFFPPKRRAGYHPDCIAILAALWADRIALRRRF